jgi:4-amino-4-deoxy-L-arabinose transferase-like glycosyltransferase
MGAVLAANGALLLWNAWRYDWLRGYDAYANDEYASTVADEHRLPSADDSGVWHTPPLWFAVAGVLRRAALDHGWGPAQRPGQLLAAAAGFAVCVLVFLLARELWPERRGLHLLALVAAAASPALVRASAMYHPETLAVALAAGGMLVAVHALRTRWTVWSGLGAGVLLGLAGLTRAWALPVLAAVVVAACLDAWSRRRWLPVALLFASSLVLIGPWLANEQRAHGSALAFNRPAPSGSVLSRRPASFYVGPRSLRALEHPVTPLFRNELVPHLYADWWGDWALTWDSPPPPAPGQLLPSSVVSERARQAVIGIVPSVLALAGIVALALLAVARRSAAVGLLPLSALGVAGAYALFAVLYPSTDGDTIKGTYLLMALPAVSVGLAFVVDALRPHTRAATAVTAAVVALFVVAQLPFLIL